MVTTRYIACDYGTQNPTVYLDLRDDGDTIWVMDEYYYDGRARGKQKEDSEYADDLESFVGSDYPRFVVIDPAASSLKTTVKNRGFRVKDADNDVLDGIRAVSTMFFKKKLRIHRENCPNLMKELSSYSWDAKAVNRGEEKPIKQNDHACDALRYFIFTVLSKRRIYG